MSDSQLNSAQTEPDQSGRISLKEAHSLGKLMWQAVDGFTDNAVWILLEYDPDDKVWTCTKGSILPDGMPNYRVCGSHLGLMDVLRKIQTGDVSESNAMQIILQLRLVHRYMASVDAMIDEG